MNELALQEINGHETGIAHLKQVSSRIFWAVGLLFAALLVGTSLLGYFLFHPQVYVRDEWPLFLRYTQHSFWQSIWAQYHGQRLFFPGIVRNANMAWLHGNLTYVLILSLLLQLSSMWLLTRDAAKRLAGAPARILLFVLAAMMVLWMGNAFSYLFLSLTYTLGVFGALAASYCIYHGALKSTQDANGWLWLLAAMVCATISTFSWGSGIVVWPVLIVLYLALRAPRITWLTVCLVGSAMLYAYTQITLPLGDHNDVALPANWKQVVNLFHMTLAVLGSMPTHVWIGYPDKYSRLVRGWSHVTGVLGLLWFLGLILWWAGRRRERHWLMPIFGAALFSVGTTLIIGLVRGVPHAGAFTAHGLTERYTIFSSIFWIALVCGTVAAVCRKWSRTGQKSLLAGTVAVLALALAWSQAGSFMWSGRWNNKVDRAILSMGTGTLVRWPIFMQLDFLNVGGVVKATPYLREHRLTFFTQPWTNWLNTKLGGTEQVKTIPGGLTQLKPDPDAWKIQGWTSVAYRGARVVAADQRNEIHGMAIPFQRLPKEISRNRALSRPWWLDAMARLNPDLPLVLGWGRGWYGYVELSQNPRNLDYYLVDSDKNVIARLGQKKQEVE